MGNILQLLTGRLTCSTGLCYGGISLFSTILHNIFILYHIDMFVSVFKIDKTSFWVGESIFLVWNSFNDPLFGWIGDGDQAAATSSETSSRLDTSYSAHMTPEALHKQSNDIHYSHHPSSQLSEKKVTSVSPSIIIRRTKIISYCGPLMALSFSLLWFDWLIPSIQFTICLCLYDSFLTMIDLQQSALLTDLSITTESRTSMNSYDSVFSAVGSISVFLSYQLWDKNDLAYFRTFCVVLAIFSAIGFYVVSHRLRTSYMQSAAMNRGSKYQGDSYNYSTRTHITNIYDKKPLKLFLKQMLSHTNFLVFTAINVIQVFHCHFNSNFFPFFMETLVEDHKHYGAFLIGISFVMPHVNNLLFLRMCRHYGLYTVIKLLFSIKLVLALIMWSTGPTYGWLMCFFIASNRVFTEGTCKLLILVVSDLVDEDYVRNSRTEPLSALIFGTANFLAKPGQTLAPIIGTSLFSFMTGHDLFTKSSSVHGIALEGQKGTTYKYACFKMLVYVPLVCGALQIMIWSFYKLHGTRLQRIKSVRSNLQMLLTV